MADLLSSLPIHMDPAYPNGVELVTPIPVGTNNIGGVELIDGAGVPGKVAISADGALKVEFDPTLTPTIAVSGLNFDGSGDLKVNLESPLPAGGNTIGDVGLIAGSAIVGKVGIDQTAGQNGVVLEASLPAGTNAIGSVDITNTVAVSGAVAVTGSIAVSGQNYDGFGNLDVNINAPLPAGGNNIGGVDLLSSIPAGTNQIGFVGIDQTGSGNGVQIASGPGFAAISPLFVQTSEVAGGIGTLASNPEFVELVAGSALVGSFGIDQTTPGANDINVLNLPAIQTVSIAASSSLPAGANALGSVNITGTSLVSGTVGIDNFPVEQSVHLSAALPAGSNEIGTVGIVGTSAVSGIVGIDPANNAVSISGDVTLSGTSAVSGTISVANVSDFLVPNQLISGDVGLLGTSAVSGIVGIDPSNNGVQISAGLGSTSGTPLFVSDTNFALNNAANPEFVQSVAGSASIGTVGLDAGSNAIGSVEVTNTVAVSGAIDQAGLWNVGLLGGTASIGTVGLDAGTNPIGSVNVTGTSLVSGTVGVNNFPLDQVVHLSEAIPAGSALIGNVGIDQSTPGANDVNVLNLPAIQTVSIAASSSLPAGANALGSVNVTGTSAVSGIVAVSNFPLEQSVHLSTSVPAGSAVIGSVGIDQSLPGTSNAVALSGGLGSTVGNPLFVDSTTVNSALAPMFVESVAGSAVIGSIANTSFNVGNFPPIQSVSLDPGSTLPFGTNALGSVNVTGTSMVSGTVGVNNFPAFPADQVVHLSEAIPAGGNAIGSVQVSNTVAVSGAVAVTGSIAVSGQNYDGAGNLMVDLNTPLPAGGNPLGSVNITGTSAVSGIVGIDLANNSVNVLNYPIDQAVHLSTAIPAGSAIIGEVGIDPLHNVVSIDATNNHVNVDNLPAIQTVSIAVSSSLPAGTNALGSVNITGTSLVSGTVSIDPINNHVVVDNDQAVHIASGAGFAPGAPLYVQTAEVSGGVGTLASNPEFVQSVAGSASIGSVSINPGGTVGLDAGTNPIGSVNITGTSAVSGTVSVSGVIFDGASNLMVDLATALPSGGNVIGSIANTNFAVNNLPAVQTVSILASSSLPAGVNPLGSVNVTGTSAVSGTVSVSGQNYDLLGNLDVNVNTPLPIGTNVIGKVALDPASTNTVLLSGGMGSSNLNPLFVDSTTVNDALNPMFVESVAGSAIIGKVGIDPANNIVNVVPAEQSVHLSAAVPAGSAIIGVVGIDLANNHVIVDNLSADQTVTIAASSMLPFGTNALGSVNVTGTSAVSGIVGLDIAHNHVNVDSLPLVSIDPASSLPHGTLSIGTVGLDAGFNAIGSVSVSNTVAVSGAIDQAGPWNVGLLGTSAVSGVVGIDQTSANNGVQVVSGPGFAAISPLYVSDTNFALNDPTHPEFVQSVAGSAIIGSVGIDQVTLHANEVNVLNYPADQTVHLSTAIPAGSAVIGNVGLIAGSANIGGVDLLSSIPAGGNAIGSVDVTNTVAVSGAVSVSGDISVAGQTYDLAGNLNVNLETSLPTGSNAIGSVSVSNTVAVSGVMDQAGLWNVGLNAGTANIGGVELVDAGGVNKASISADGAQLVALDPAVTNTVALSGGFGSSNANPLFIEIASGDAGIVQNSGMIVSASIAPSLEVSTNSAAISVGKVASLQHVTMASSSQMRYDLGYIDNSGTSHVQYTMFSSTANLNTEFKPSLGAEFSLPGADGANAKFFVSATNMDQVNTNNSYITFCWIEV